MQVGVNVDSLSSRDKRSPDESSGDSMASPDVGGPNEQKEIDKRNQRKLA